MSVTKRNHSIEFKTKVGLDAIKEKQTIEEIAHKYEVHPSLVKNWKKLVIDNISNCFLKETKSNKVTESETNDL